MWLSERNVTVWMECSCLIHVSQLWGLKATKETEDIVLPVRIVYKNSLMMALL
jgi:hypothetical protein